MTVTPVPECASDGADDLTLKAAWRTLRAGRWTIWAQMFARFRYGDGFSHSRALGLQICLALIPLVIAGVGLRDALHSDRLSEVLRLTLVSLAPGSSDQLVRNSLTRPQPGGEDGARLALWLGLLFAIFTLTTAMGQFERGANRIYGVPRDRPTPRKYGRALLMALAAGLSALVGFMVLIAGSAFGEAVEEVYGYDDDWVTAVALPSGAVLLLVSITAMLRYCPRRRQPGWLWLAPGAVVALALSLALTALLVGYLYVSDTFGTVYGPLTAVIALLLWAQLVSAAIFSGVAVVAQLEASHRGIHVGATRDPLRPAQDP